MENIELTIMKIIMDAIRNILNDKDFSNDGKVIAIEHIVHTFLVEYNK
jgi:hypothetical protein